MPDVIRRPAFWLGAFLLWLTTLWALSSSSNVGPELPSIPNIDKIAHFGFFFGGSGLLCGWLYFLNPENPNWLRIITTAICIIAFVGILDEYHQTFTPGRTGNDPFDWLADLFGATCGVIVFKALHRFLK